MYREEKEYLIHPAGKKGMKKTFLERTGIFDLNQHKNSIKDSLPFIYIKKDSPNGQSVRDASIRANETGISALSQAQTVQSA